MILPGRPCACFGWLQERVRDCGPLYLLATAYGSWGWEFMIALKVMAGFRTYQSSDWPATIACSLAHWRGQVCTGKWQSGSDKDEVKIERQISCPLTQQMHVSWPFWEQGKHINTSIQKDVFSIFYTEQPGLSQTQTKWVYLENCSNTLSTVALISY